MVDFNLIIDTREQNPLDFELAADMLDLDIGIVKDALKTGDYSVVGFEDQIAVERKSFDDLINCSYGDNHDRFRREFERAENLDHFVVMIEAPRWWLYDYKDTGNCPHYRSNVHPNAPIGMVEKWAVEYDTHGFRWAGNRSQAAYETLKNLAEWIEE